MIIFTISILVLILAAFIIGKQLERDIFWMKYAYGKYMVEFKSYRFLRFVPSFVLQVLAIYSAIMLVMENR